MKSYRVLQRFIDNGTTHEAGSTAEFDELRGGQLIGFGLIADAPEAALNSVRNQIQKQQRLTISPNARGASDNGRDRPR